ncbi:hypothetical protein Dimus_000340 [Dionaea muscipula]
MQLRSDVVGYSNFLILYTNKAKMSCHVNYATIPHHLRKNPTHKFNYFQEANLHQPIPPSSSWTNRSRRRSSPARVSAIARTKDSYIVRIKTLDGCKIGFSNYNFEYNADGGKGAGHGTKLSDGNLKNDSVSITFDPKTMYIPPVDSATTKMYGWPLPPFLKIEIIPEVLQGSINEESGKIDIKLRAKYWFSIGSGYKAPPLIVETILTTDESRGSHGSTRGKRRGKDGRCRLVGIATLGPLKDSYMNSLLGLPAECVTEMNAIIYFI